MRTPDSRSVISDQTLGAILGLSTAILTAVFLLCFRAAEANRGSVVFGIFLWAAIFNSGLALTRLKSTPLPNRKWILSVVFLASMTVMGNLALGFALTYLSPGVTSTMMQLQIFFVALAAWAFIGERVSVLLILGAGVAIGGFTVFALPSEESTNLPSIGLIFGIVTAMCFASMIVWIRAVIHDLDPISLNAGRLWIAALAMALWPGVLHGAESMSARSWLLLIGAAASGPFVGRLCIMYSLRFISAAQTKLWGMLSPIFAFLFVYLIYGVVPSAREVVGGLLIVSGVLLPTLLAFRISREKAV